MVIFTCLLYRENDITDVLEHTFCVDTEAFGKMSTHELKPGGKDITVTEDNKKEYVRSVSFSKSGSPSHY